MIWPSTRGARGRLEDRLNVLLNYFVDLCLLRAAPQDLPASPVLLALALIANLLVGTLLAVRSSLGLVLSATASLVEIVLMLAVLRLALNWRGRGARFQQTATAVMGSSTLISLLVLPLLGLGNASTGSDLATLAVLLRVALVIWSLVVLGHILRHAFDIALGLGIAIGVLYTVGSYMVLRPLFPVD
jgi:hypothetical protein